MTEIEIARKLDEIDCLIVECSDYLVHRFFDHDSLKMLDEKIEVLRRLNAGERPDKIPNYYKILEKYPSPTGKNPTSLWD